MIFPRRWSTTSPHKKRLVLLKRQGSIDSASTLSSSLPPPARTPSAVIAEKPEVVRRSMITGNVHGGSFAGSAWLKKPLFAREGEPDSASGFSSGQEAVQKLQDEAVRRDPFQSEYADSLHRVTGALVPVIERQPKYAWVMKQLMEPERFATFRVSWQDDSNNWRMNRGYRLLYSSALPSNTSTSTTAVLRLDHRLTHGHVRMLGFEQVFQGALSGVGSHEVLGADLNPVNRSAQELARFASAFAASAGLDKDSSTVEIAGQQPQPLARRAKFAVALAGELANGAGIRDKACVVTGSSRAALQLAKELAVQGARVQAVVDATGYVYSVNGAGMDVESILALEQQLALRRSKDVGAAAGDGGVGLASCFHLNRRVHHRLGFNHAHASDVWKTTAAGVEVVFLADSTGELAEDDANKLVLSAASSSSSSLMVLECVDRACTAAAAAKLASNNRVLLAPSKLVLSGNGGEAVAEAEARERLAVVRAAAEEFGFPVQDLDAGASVAAFQRLAASPMFKLPNDE